jgi:hypothetical protein
MLSVAFKNGIIMLLIILIIHFIIKNYIFTLHGQGNIVVQVERDVSKSFKTEVGAITDENFIEKDEKDMIVQTTPLPAKPFVLDEEELFKYVQSLEDSKQIMFDANTKNASTCDDAFETIDTSIKKGKPIDPSKTNTPYYMLSEYDDENVMNGGHLFKNIDGFEESVKYSDYEKLT